jgi:hypothetical protein
MQGDSGEVIVDLKTGRRTARTVELELWSDRDFGHAHFVMRIDGKAADILLPDDMTGGGPNPTGGIDPAYTAFWTGYQKALENGDATLERQGEIDGRRVYWLRFTPVKDGEPGTEVAIDSTTYKPVVLRTYSSPTSYNDLRILVAETIPYDSANFKRVGASLLAGVGSVSSGGSSSLTGPNSGTAALRAPWLTPGERVAGLTRVSVGGYTATANGRTVKGIELRYGTAEYGRGSLTIDELQRPEDPELWKAVPRGSIRIQKGSGSDQRHAFDTWTAQVVVHGIYVTIDTGAGEDAVLEVARALRPAP